MGINVDDRVIERAADELGGIVGWLVYFGRLYPKKCEDAINEVKEIGANLVRSELEELFSRSQYYRYIMEAVAVLGKARWSDVMKYLMARMGEKPTNATLSRDLNNLVKMGGFLTKDNDWYSIPDPIVRYAVLRAIVFHRYSPVYQPRDLLSILSCSHQPLPCTTPPEAFL